MKLTSENLHRCATYNGTGFNREQLRLLGVKWPPKAGWLKRLIGKTIPDDVYGQIYRMGQKNGEKFRKKTFETNLQGPGKFRPISKHQTENRVIESLRRQVELLERRIKQSENVQLNAFKPSQELSEHPIDRVL